ncbi:MAG: hypothetical protein HZA01_08155 [Nitrospinae bacterium]|nr:hypothetical protein [Nitrospinota bacterium]
MHPIASLFKDKRKSGPWGEEVDPRLKIILALAALAFNLSFAGPIPSLMLALVCFLAILAGGVSCRDLSIRLLEPLFIALVLFLVMSYEGEFSKGALLSSHIIGAVSVVLFLSFTTPLPSILNGLAWFRVSSAWIEVALHAYRFIFLFLEDARTIHGAQKMRLGYAGGKRGLVSLGCLAGLLVVRSFEKSGAIAEALALRCYDGAFRSVDHASPGFRDCLFALYSSSLLGILWTLDGRI